MSHMSRPSPHSLLALIVLLLGVGPGCTSVLSTASLRDLVWDGDAHAAETAPTEADPDADAAVEAGEGSPDADTTADAQRREAAIEEATDRLAKLGHLEDTARASLTATLERTQPEDWPAVIDAFAESLAAADVPTEPALAAGDAVAPEPERPDPHMVAKAALDVSAENAAATATEVTTALDPPPQSESAPAVEPSPAAQTDPGDSADDQVATSPAPSPVPPAVEPLAIANACFASRVQAWGVLDRFTVDQFRPGQEVIVYFELDGLSAGESPAGHTTCIDSELQLVDEGGSVIHAWSFEPIAETCRARRRDYFARYVVRLPEAVAPGGCRVDVTVTDTLSGNVATASLPLEVLPDAGP
jgi:hypothetical protein